MQFFDFQNFFSILIIFATLIASGFSLYIPLVFILKSKDVALKFSLPISFSIEIIFGYIFYDLEIVSLFPLTYLGLIIILNLYFLKKLNYQFPKLLFFEKLIKSKNFLISLILLIPIFYTRFYDSVTNIAPGSLDTFNHITFLKDLSTTGFLNNTYYAPGFHLLLYPLTFFIPYEDIYRFTGPVLGIITILSFFLLFKNYFKNTLSKVFLILLFTFPIFNQLTLQTIGFFSSALSFIFITGFIYLVSKPKELSEKIIIIFYLILSTALAVTVPYLYVQLIPVIFIILLSSYLFKNIMNLSFMKKIFIITLLGFIISFTHVYIQTNILHPNGSFPKINTANKDGSTNSTYQYIKDPSAFNRYALPMTNTGIDVLKIKNIRPTDTVLGAGAYIWIIISFFMFFYSIKRKNSLLFNLSIFSIIFGISTQTGILELSYYRGRCGWYLLLFSLLGATFIFDEFYQTKFIKYVYTAFALIFLTTFLRPPVFYRPYFTDIFAFAYKIKKEYPNQKINFITSQKQISLISQNFSTLPLEVESLKKEPSKPQFLILDDVFFNADPILSQQALSTDKNFTAFERNRQTAKQVQKNNITEIKQSSAFGNFKKFSESKNITTLISK